MKLREVRVWAWHQQCRAEQSPHRSQRILDYVLYVAIALALCGAVTGMAPYTNVDGDLVFKWVAMLANTAIAFYYPLSGIPGRLRVRSVWVTWSALLLLHAVVYRAVLVRVRQWSGVYFLLVTMFEASAVSLVLGRVANRNRAVDIPSRHPA